jgi:AhpD family alkylhydroperoxidase
MNAQATTVPRVTDAYRAMLGVERAMAKSTIEKTLQELVKLRVSQINGCAYCIDLHWKDAVAAGESPHRLYSLPAWRETPHYSHREQAALQFAEALTRLADRPVAERAHEEAREQFDEQELDDLAWVIAAINAWNRHSIATRKQPGEDQPGTANG